MRKKVFGRLGIVALLAPAAISFAPVSVGAEDQSAHATGYLSLLCSERPEPAACTTEELRRDFMVVVERGNKNDVLQMVRKLRDLGFLNTIEGYSPLAWVIGGGKSEVVAVLLAEGADPLAIDRHGRLFLYQGIAAAYSSTPELPLEVVKCVRVVLESAARSGRLPPKPPLDASIVFFGGAKKPSLELLKLFIAHGAEPNRKGWYWYDGSPLDAAIAKNNLEAVRIMIAPGSRISQAELDEKAFDALMKRKHELLAVLRSSGAVPARYMKANPRALSDAVRSGGMQTLAYLLKNGADPDVFLFNAVQPEGSAEMLEFLLKSGANPNAVNFAFQTPVFETRDPEKLRILFKHGGDPNFRKDYGYTALANILFTPGSKIPVPATSAPAQKPRVYDKALLVKLFLDHGADPNIDHGGWGQYGALGHTRREDRDVTNLLIGRGATLTNRVDPRLNVLKEARGVRADIVRGPLAIAIDVLERDDLALVLLARDGEVGPQDQHALLGAVRRGWRDVTQALLRAGADPNIADAQGLTPLAMAERRKDKVLVKMLVAAGANPSARPAPHYKIDAGGEFENAVAAEIDDVVFLDPPRFVLGGVKETPFVLYGEQKTERGQGFEQIKCERSVTFTIVINGGIAGGISAGVCAQEAERMRKLAVAADQSINTLLGQLAEGGVNPGQLDRNKLGWKYEKKAGPNQSEIYYFPLIVIGHGVLSASTAVLVSANHDKAIIVQADVMKLCGEGHNMQSQTPLCSDMKGAITDIAQRLFTRFGRNELALE